MLDEFYRPKFKDDIQFEPFKESKEQSDGAKIPESQAQTAEATPDTITMEIEKVEIKPEIPNGDVNVIKNEVYEPTTSEMSDI